MKNSIKSISAILTAAIMLATVFLTAVPIAAENEGKGSYISTLSGLVMTKEDQDDFWSMDAVDFQKNVDMLSERGYKALWFDFNQESYNASRVHLYGSVESYSYFFAPFALGYQTSANRKDAITDIVIFNGDNPTATIETNGCTYTLMGGWEFEDEVETVDGLDLNRFTKGDYLYLYYTKDTKAGEPIVALKGSNSDTEAGYECVRDTSGSAADLNKGSNLAFDCVTYLHIQRGAATTGSIFGGGNTTLVIVIIAAVVVIGAGLGIFFAMKKKNSVK